MFFDIGAGEVLGLAILGMMLVGPERLPKLAVEAAQWDRDSLGQFMGYVPITDCP